MNNIILISLCVLAMCVPGYCDMFQMLYSGNTVADGEWEELGIGLSGEMTVPSVEQTTMELKASLYDEAREEYGTTGISFSKEVEKWKERPRRRAAGAAGAGWR